MVACSDHQNKVSKGSLHLLNHKRLLVETIEHTYLLHLREDVGKLWEEGAEVDVALFVGLVRVLDRGQHLGHDVAEASVRADQHLPARVERKGSEKRQE